MAEVQSHMAERDRKINIIFMCQRKEARELEREGLQMAASLYGENQALRRR